jgi:hypothetical protein
MRESIRERTILRADRALDLSFACARNVRLSPKLSRNTCFRFVNSSELSLNARFGIPATFSASARVRWSRTKVLFLIPQMLHEFGEVFALQGALGDRVPNRCCLFSGYLTVTRPQVKNQIVRI